MIKLILKNSINLFINDFFIAFKIYCKKFKFNQNPAAFKFYIERASTK